MPLPDRRALAGMSGDEALSIRLSRLAARRQHGMMNDAAYASAYFLLWQTTRHGRRFASRKSKFDARPELEKWLLELEQASGEALHAALIRWLERYQFLGIVPNVPSALLGWLRNQWPLRLTFKIPPPDEVLRMQAAGVRPVTVIADYSRAVRPVLAKADGFAFMIHDLEHAYKFFHDPWLNTAQQRFFERILGAIEVGLFEPYRADPVFARQFDYLISDMNTHPVHSLRYLGAVLVECLLRREGKGPKAALSPVSENEMACLLRELGTCWEFPKTALIAFQRLLGAGFDEADAAAIERAFCAQDKLYLYV